MNTYTIWSKERDIGIRRALKPATGFSLSGVALIVEGGIGYSYIKFTEETVRKLGMQMPYGIGPAHPAFIKIVSKHDYYDVMCVYTDKSKSIVLWKSEALPDWIGSIKYKK